MLCFVTTTGTVLSQESEQELKETADKLFFEEKYTEAKPYVERLLALQPRSFDYQFKYGTCLLYNGYKKSDAFKYLQYSVTDPNINVAAYYFLGKAYHLTYSFNEAIKNYNIYKQKAGNNINPKYEVDRQVAMCQNGKKLLSGLTEIVVLEKKEYTATEFFRIYDLKNIGGQILVGYDFQSKIDKKKNYVPLIHFPATSKVIYYASYGETDKGNKDLYFCVREGTGWSKPTLVPGSVNTTSDEDFPYMHPDGEHLYFSSKGHNSMGGYDVFMATKSTSGSFTEVENVDFAISSADNDMFYIVDSLNQRACFASARQANNGKMFIYTVKVDRLKMQTAVIKGDFASTIKPENKKINIVVKEAKTNKTVGTFNTDSKGNYLITLPQAGNYVYEMKVDGSSIVHKYDLKVPASNEFKPLKQHIQEDLADSKEKVTVSDRFDESFDDPMAVLAEVIQQKAELNVNVQNFTDEQLNPTNTSGITAALGLNGKTPQQQAEIISDIAETQEDKFLGTQKLVDGAKVNALKALTDADQKQAIAKQLVAKSANESDEEKYKLLKEAQSILDQANDSKDEAKMLLKFADSIAPTIAVEEKKFNELKALSEAVSEAGVNNDEAKIKTLVEEKANLIAETKKANASNPIQPVIDEKKKIVAQENKLDEDMASYKESEKRIEKDIAALKTELAEAKAKDKPAIESKIASKEQELGLVKDEIQYQTKKIEDLKAVEKTLDAKLKFLQDINNTTIANAPTSDAVKQKLNEVDSKNSRSMNDYVDQQVKELEKNAAIAAIKENPTNTELTTAIDKEWSDIQKVLDERKNEEASLSETGNLSEQEKAQIRVENDKKALTEIEETQNALEELLAKSPENTSIKEKIASLEAEKTKTNTHLKEQEKIVTSGLGTTATVNTPEKEVVVIYPTYQTEKSAVKESNPLDQLIGLNKVDKKLLDKTTAELTKVEGQLADNPGNDELNSRKDVLETLKKQTEANIASRDKAIASMSGSETANLSNEKLIEQLSPTYEEKKNAISNTDKRLELEERNELDQELLFSITAEKNKITEQLAANPTDKALNDRKNALQTLETKVKKDVAMREAEMEKLPEATVQSTPDKELAIVEPDYQRKFDAIDKSTPKTELQGRIALNTTVLGSAKDELGQINESLASQPENKTLQSRKDAINELITKLEGDLSTDKAELEKLETPVVDNTSTQLKKEVRPEYEANLAKIDASDKSEEEKAIARVKEEQALLTSISDEIKATDKLLAKTPNDQSLANKKADLTELQAIQEASIQEKEEDLVSIERAKIEPTDFQKEIAPKFTTPTPGQLETQNAEQQKALATAEQELRETLVKKQQANEKALTKGFDPKLVAENRVISILVERSVERENKIGETTTPEVSPRDLLVQELTPEQNESFTQKPTSKEEIKEYRAILEELQQDVMKQADSPNLSAEERSVKRSQSVVIQQRLNELNAIDRELDNAIASTNKNPENTTTTNETTKELVQLDQRESEIKTQLATATPKEQKQLQKELTAIDAKQEVIKDSLNTVAISEIKKDQNQIIESLPQDNAVTEVLQSRVVDPKANKETQRIEEQKKLSLAEAAGISAVAQNNFEKENVVTASPEALAKAKRRFTIEVGDLTAERAALGTSTQDEARKTQIDKEIAAFNKSIDAIEEMERANTLNIVETNLAKEGLDVAVTPEKEMEIRSNPEYQKALIDQQELTQVIQQRRGIQKDIAAEQAKFDNGDPTASVEKLKGLIEEDKSLQQEQQRLENKLRSDLASKGTDADAWKNVVSREMPYVAPAVSTEELEPFVADGFKINEPNANVKPVLNKDLPIGIKMPSGLVYRVQVGAFAKPVPEELFKEFTPVTGEKLNNGITRYMAGFFGNRDKVMDAQKNIRALGYNDAFVVAYCDGERITLAEARRLEDAGLCVPKDQNEIAIEVTQNVIAQLPQDSLRPSVKEIKPGDYNKADGAAVAMAVEEKLGLFYTVQVGVYNKPVPATQLKNIDPLVTKRLPNGQIRYSSGIFQSVNSALPKKKEAIALGITDAFITAYYKGERISLEEARKILKENGVGVLEPLETPVEPKKIEQQIAEAIKEEQKSSAATPNSNVKAALVSSVTYTSYPEKEIKLLNTVGTFYYDSLDQKIKSATYSSVGALPTLENLPVSFDTLQVGKIESAIEQNGKYAEVSYNDAISGALANYLLRGNIPFEIVTMSETNTSKLRVYASKTGNFEVILNQMQLLGVSAEVQNEE